MFRPDTTVFDCNAALGRPHNRPIPYNNAEDLLCVMDETGISRALVHSPHSIHFGTSESNRLLMEEVGGNRWTPAWDSDMTAGGRPQGFPSN
jgi:hypothetical protein